jgi:hypothetical protein
MSPEILRTLTVDTLAAIYHDLRSQALSLPRTSPLRERLARAMQVIRVILSQRGYEVRLTETGDGYQAADIVPVVPA